MASGKKKLGSWTHEASGITIDYFIEGTRFVCVCLEETVSAPEASVLRAQVFDRIEHWMTMEWFPVIEIEVDDNNCSSYRDEPEGDAVSVKAKRFYISRSPAGRVKRVEWDVEEVHRKAKMRDYGGSELQLTRLPLKCPLVQGRGDGTLIDYNEEAWEALQQIIKAIGQIREQVGKMIKTKAGIEKLSAAGTRVLMLGTGK